MVSSGLGVSFIFLREVDSELNRFTDNSPLDPGVFNNGDGSVVAIYDYETYPPPSTNGNGGLGFIGMQRCLDCPSSPIAELASRHAAQGWATVFSLNEPDINGISPAQAAAFHEQYINPLVTIRILGMSTYTFRDI